MRRLLRSLLVPAVAAAFVACGEHHEENDDDTPPRVVTIEPSVSIIPTSVRFRVIFSEAMNEKTVTSDPASDRLSVVFVERAVVSDSFLSDLRRPPLSASRHASVIPVSVALAADGTAITIEPLGRLQENTPYTLIISAELRDEAGNPLVDVEGKKAAFVWDVKTDAGAPSVLATDLPSDDHQVVVANRKRITVTFSQPVTGISPSALRLAPHADGARAPVVDTILIDEARERATMILGSLGAGCERLAPNAGYTLEATADIRGDDGQALTPFAQSFTTSAACDLQANTMGPVDVSPGEVTAVVRFDTSKASTAEVRFGLVGGPLDCLGGPCPVHGAPSLKPRRGVVPPAFPHAVVIEGLTLGERYHVVAIAEDDTGSVARGESAAFVTEALARLVINEVMANPPSTATEPADEYIELHNWGNDPIDLTGFSIQVNETRSCALGEQSLAPGGYLLLVGARFNGAVYGGVDEKLLLRAASSASFCGQLTNTSLQRLELKDASDRAISTMSTHEALLPHKDGFSSERANPAAPDLADSWCRSRADSGPTPGRENGVVSRGCDS